MKEIIITPFKSGAEFTLGKCTVDGEFVGYSLEKGWKDNKKNVSCIPSGVYDVVLEYSNRFKKELWEIKGVPNRSECKFHAANFAYQLEGCIALGVAVKDIDGDGIPDVAGSRIAMRKFHKVLSGEEKACLRIERA
jgi:hypothetical protein